jgi:hypothetical protein
MLIDGIKYEPSVEGEEARGKLRTFIDEQRALLAETTKEPWIHRFWPAMGGQPEQNGLAEPNEHQFSSASGPDFASFKRGGDTKFVISAHKTMPAILDALDACLTKWVELQVRIDRVELPVDSQAKEILEISLESTRVWGDALLIALVESLPKKEG